MTAVLDIRGLHVGLKVGAGRMPVLEDITLDIGPGEIMGIVGESGCGKSALALSLMGLLPPVLEQTGGDIRLNGTALGRGNPTHLKAIRGREIAMIFQDPLTSLNPGWTIGAQVAEMLQIHQGHSRRQARQGAEELLHQVGLPRPELVMQAYPHQLSGGMRQRVMIAMAISCRPKLLIADEPTTALDVTIQAQILDLLRRINREYGTAILLVSHDLGVIGEICSRVAVMYAGRIVEEGKVPELFQAPVHPYTRALLDSRPTPDKKHGRLSSIPGTVPALSERGRGCGFSSRCSIATDRCRAEAPIAIRFDGGGVSCWEARFPDLAAPAGKRHAKACEEALSDAAV